MSAPPIAAQAQAQAQAAEERSPSVVVAGVLDELAPYEGVAVSESGAKSDLSRLKASVGELTVKAPVKQLPTQIVMEIAPIEQPPTLKVEEAAPFLSSPSRDRTVSPPPEPVYQTPRVTKGTPESTAFYEHFYVRASRPIDRDSLLLQRASFLC